MTKDGDFQRPFLKWAGGKFAIIDRVRYSLPQGGRLLEPFVGGGSVFLNTDFEAYQLCDVNPDIVWLYQLLQAEGQSFVAHCQTLFRKRNNTDSRYYHLRDKFNATDFRRAPEERAALFLYLNRHGYRGLCRYNAAGGFNVPFGHYVAPHFPRAEMLAFHDKARQAEFSCCDFRDALANARAGDVVYCDPPYVPLSRSSNFTAYHSGGFGERDQRDLGALARGLAERGVTVVISNHNTKFTRELYAGAQIRRFAVKRPISRQLHTKTSVPELIAIFPAV